MALTAIVPPEFRPEFIFAESTVRRYFSDLQIRSQGGLLLVGDERYVLMRSDSLYFAWFEALASKLGEKATVDLLYTAAREMGRNDAKAFLERSRMSNFTARVASAFFHMAFSGLSAVEIFSDTQLADNDSFFLHYAQVNTFESEALAGMGRRSFRCACFYTAGFAAGFCTEAMNMHLHVREIQCVARGEERCEFLMAPRQKLEEHFRRLRAGTPAAVKG